ELRERCGPATVLVGFKLLSGVTTAALTEAAKAQLERCDLDAVVANDLAEITGGQHPVWLVRKTGAPHRIEGAKASTARALVARIVPTRAPAVLHPLLDLPGIAELRTIDTGLVLPTTRAATPAAAWHALGRAFPPDGFSVALAGRIVLGLPDPTEFDADVAALMAEAPEPGAPVLAGVTPVGVLTERPDGAFALWIAPAHLSEGLADDLAVALDRRGSTVEVAERYRQFLVERGWQPLPDDRYAPPSLRTDLQPAASACLVYGDRVLIGRRLVGAWPGHWAFPGGGVEPGESRIDAALRELHEETGIAVPPGQPVATVDIAVSWGDGGRAWDLTCFVFPVPAAARPECSAELEARWVSLSEARSLRPMGAGTRRVMRRLPALLRQA
ncbi:MAG: 8-oxo-dGTP diphosphatase, partial [Myxococcota bacterium]